MNMWSIAAAVATVGGLAAVALVRAQSGEPPVIGPTAKPELPVSTPKEDEKPKEEVVPAPLERQVSTSCEDELAQAAEEIEWWREQLAQSTPAAAVSSDGTNPDSPPEAALAPAPPGTTVPPGTLAEAGTAASKPTDPNALPTATALKAAADPRLAAVDLQGIPPTTDPVLLAIPPLERPRLGQVAALIKDMKPRDAAQVMAGLDDALAVGVLSRMSPRAGSAISAALPPEHAARLLTRLSQLPLPVEPKEEP
jgi:hypothetical protein